MKKENAVNLMWNVLETFSGKQPTIKPKKKTAVKK
jgi:hypothetical protein